MAIIIKPTKIKSGFYLLIPKTIAELIDVKDTTEFTLKISFDGNKSIEYIQMLPAIKRKTKSKRRTKAKRRTVRKQSRKKSKRIKRRRRN